MALIFLAEDDPGIRRVTQMHLTLAGHTVREAEDAAQFRGLLHEQKPDLALLDIMMPGEDGFSLGNFLIGMEIPVIFLTARTDVTDRVRGLRSGAEDYILKPFEPAELLARVENALRRNVRGNDKISQSWSSGAFSINFDSRQVFYNGQSISMTALEFDLLAYLVRHRGEAISRDSLLAAVWGYQYTGESRTVDVHVQRLRGKLGSEWIETVYKYGYRFQPKQPNP